MSDIVERIRDYLSSGGLFNPELADHAAVRDLLVDARETILALRAGVETLTEAVQRARRHADNIGITDSNYIAQLDAALATEPVK